MFAEDTSEVVDVAFDDFQWTAAVLLLQTWLAIDVGHSGVVQIDRVETDPVITGGFPQNYLVLRENSYMRSDCLRCQSLTLYSAHILQDLQLSQSGALHPSHSWQCAYLCGKDQQIGTKTDKFTFGLFPFFWMTFFALFSY